MLRKGTAKFSQGGQMIHEIRDRPADIGPDAPVSVAGTVAARTHHANPLAGLVVLTGVLLTIAGVACPAARYSSLAC